MASVARYGRRDQYAEAQKTFETALRELEKLSQTDLQRLQSMNSLAMAFQQQGLLNQADAKYAQALDLSERYPEHDLAAKVSTYEHWVFKRSCMEIATRRLPSRWTISPCWK